MEICLTIPRIHNIFNSRKYLCEKWALFFLKHSISQCHVGILVVPNVSSLPPILLNFQGDIKYSCFDECQ